MVDNLSLTDLCNFFTRVLVRKKLKGYAAGLNPAIRGFESFLSCCLDYWWSIKCVLWWWGALGSFLKFGICCSWCGGSFFGECLS